MIRPIESLQKPNVGYRFYCTEILLLGVAILLPFVVWLIWRDGDLLARTGSLVVFFALVAEFALLNKANIKHIKNALRIQAGEDPLIFSTPAKHITVAALIIALFGTCLWGFGSLIF